MGTKRVFWLSHRITSLVWQGLPFPFLPSLPTSVLMISRARFVSWPPNTTQSSLSRPSSIAAHSRSCYCVKYHIQCILLFLWSSMFGCFSLFWLEMNFKKSQIPAWSLTYCSNHAPKSTHNFIIILASQTGTVSWWWPMAGELFTKGSRGKRCAQV